MATNVLTYRLNLGYTHCPYQGGGWMCCEIITLIRQASQQEHPKQREYARKKLIRVLSAQNNNDKLRKEMETLLEMYSFELEGLGKVDKNVYNKILDKATEVGLVS